MILSTNSNVVSTLLPFFCNNVAIFGNNVERNFVILTKWKHEHVQFVSTLSKGRHFTINLFDIVAALETKSCFDIVGVDGALQRYD